MIFRSERSNGWKLSWAVLPVIGSLTALGAFTSPPFNSGPAQTLPMAWQCYSALVERAAAVCSNAPAIPYPANTALRLREYTILTSNLLMAATWLQTNAPITETNRLTPATILPIAGVHPKFWTNAPITGTGTDSNAWHGLRKILTNMQWTATAGANNCGTNLFIYSTPAFSDCSPDVWYADACAISTAETRFAWADETTVPGIDDQIGGLAAGVRWVAVTPPGTTYVIQTTQEYWVKDTATNCPTTYPSPPGWVHESIYDNIYTTTSCEASVPTDGWAACDDGDSVAYYMKYAVVGTITDPCSTNYICDQPYRLWLAGKSAFISFAVCSTATIYEAQEWYQGTAPDAFCNTPTGIGFSVDSTLAYPLSNGWTLAKTHAAPIFAADLCITNYATATNIPFAGSTSTNPVGWSVRRALLVNKWAFDY